MKNVQSPAALPTKPGFAWLQLLQRAFHGNHSDNANKRHSAISAAISAPVVSATFAPVSVVYEHRVLVVDDNPSNLLLVSEQLSCFGITPLLAADGAEAVALASELRLDLILMDLQMPVLDGLAATREIRISELAHQRRRVPVMAFTSSAPALAVLQDCGVDSLLEKPCNHNALHHCLQRWCPQVLAPDATESGEFVSRKPGPGGTFAGHHKVGFSRPGLPLG